MPPEPDRVLTKIALFIFLLYLWHSFPPCAPHGTTVSIHEVCTERQMGVARLGARGMASTLVALVRTHSRW